MYNELAKLAEMADSQGLLETAKKLRDALRMLNTEETQYTCVKKVFSDELYYVNASDPVTALKMAHDDLCQCAEEKLVYLHNSIGLCSLYTQVDSWRYLWKKACEHDGLDPRADFVTFSKDNPFSNLIDTL